MQKKPEDRRATKAMYWTIGIAWVVVSVLIFTLKFGIDCSRDLTGFPSSGGHPSIEPRKNDVAGVYLLTGQSLVEGGITASGIRQCRLVLRDDGSFSVEDYPDWRASGGEHGPFGSFISGSGSWSIDTVGVLYDSEGESGSIWGIRFHGMDPVPEPMALTGSREPFGLVVVLGDPDSDRELVFSRVD